VILDVALRLSWFKYSAAASVIASALASVKVGCLRRRRSFPNCPRVASRSLARENCHHFARNLSVKKFIQHEAEAEVHDFFLQNNKIFLLKKNFSRFFDESAAFLA
jgi:hypothetical protein